jgi:hypothetical protein
MQMKILGPVLFTATALCIALLCGCGSGPSGPPITVTITSPTSSPTVGGGQSVNVVATVSKNNSPSDGSVTWSLSGSTCGTSCGSLFNESPTQVTYDAPATVSANFTVTVTATSAAAPSKSASIVINVSVISVSILRKVNELAAAPSPWTTSSIEVNFVAFAQYDPNDRGVTWTLTAGGAPCSPACGSITINGQAMYTPPSSVPAAPNNQPTITATSVSDASKSDSDTFTLVDGATACIPGGSESELNGQYAILLQGWADGGSTGGVTPTVYGSSFAADGTGKITGGEERLNLPGVSGGADILPAASSYSVGSDGRGCLTLTNDSDETETLRFSLGGINGGVASKGNVILFSQDPATWYNATLTLRASGILRQQDPSAFSLSALASNYALGLSGWDDSSGTLQRYALAGTITQSNGTVSNAQLDVNDGGKLSTATLSNIDSTYVSRGLLTANLSLPGNPFPQDAQIFIINSSELVFMSSQPTGSEVTFVGRAIVAPNSFAASSLAPAYIFQSTGVSSSGGPLASIGLMDFSGVANGGTVSGTVSGTLDQYSSGNFATSAISENYTYTQVPGRVTISPPVSPATAPTPPSNELSAYLYLATPYDGIAGFGITTDLSASLITLDVQPYGFPGVPPIPALSGNFILGSGEPGDNTAFDISGVAAISSGILSGTKDVASSADLSLNNTVSAMVSVGSDGTANLGPNTFAVTNGTELFFLDEGSGGTNFPPEVQILQH